MNGYFQKFFDTPPFPCPSLSKERFNIHESLIATLISLNNSHIDKILLHYTTSALLMIVVDSESNMFHSCSPPKNHHTFSVATVWEMYWYIIPVQYIPSLLD